MIIYPTFIWLGILKSTFFPQPCCSQDAKCFPRKIAFWCDLSGLENSLNYRSPYLNYFHSLYSNCVDFYGNEFLYCFKLVRWLMGLGKLIDLVVCVFVFILYFEYMNSWLFWLLNPSLSRSWSFVVSTFFLNMATLPVQVKLISVHGELALHGVHFIGCLVQVFWSW